MNALYTHSDAWLNFLVLRGSIVEKTMNLVKLRPFRVFAIEGWSVFSLIYWFDRFGVTVINSLGVVMKMSLKCLLTYMGLLTSAGAFADAVLSTAPAIDVAGNSKLRCALTNHHATKSIRVDFEALGAQGGTLPTHAISDNDPVDTGMDIPVKPLATVVAEVNQVGDIPNGDQFQTVNAGTWCRFTVRGVGINKVRGTALYTRLNDDSIYTSTVPAR